MANPKIIFEGHAPGPVRDDFLDAVDHWSETDMKSRKLLVLCEQLRRSDDVLPGNTCEVLGIIAGSTYGQGAEAILRMVRPAAAGALGS